MVPNKPTITKVNVTANMSAVCRYKLYESQTISWKKTVYTPEDYKKQKRSVKDDGKVVPTKAPQGVSCQYKFPEEEEGKYVRIYAFVEKYNNLCQSEIFFVEPQLQTDICIKPESVKADKPEAIVGETVKCTVEYHNPKKQKDVPEKDVPQSIKDAVKWNVKIDEKTDRLIIDDEVTKGGVISFKIPEEWAGKEILLMPYLNQSAESISYKINIRKQELIITTRAGIKLFTLDGDSYNLSGQLTAHELYARGLQWFEPSADNYIPLVSIESNITSRTELKHFSWVEIVSFAEISRIMTSYRPGGSGDWKASEEGAGGYILVTIGGVPYWADAIGQIPFAVDYYTDTLESTGNKNTARIKTIERGKQFGDGVGINQDHSNSYDNAMVNRAIQWCSQRYNVGKKKWTGYFELIKTDYAPEKLSFK